ncbi:MAG: biotin/lipoyl-binding protein [Acidimicrobiia bacterium]|nr:biotin/lipoyl-binding protein [bacterium]MXX00825.1 biotin/lipoyl-binding protein [Acidimicrobiia bacterium]MXX45031.1 biotin/lipoyl-binding protein [Acidimicrobiia bacterium]MXY74524.1 biotin/lipoyl-binding protein [Acidimicrobiia bacterium]MYA38548.1 biotin/lipoyl-binding protein [Acidimicrobiia bacterium]
MRYEVRMPRLGETVDEVVLLEWLVEVGDQVDEGAELALVETDKVETEVPSPVAGTVTELTVSEDAEVKTGDAICVIET